MKKQQQGKLSFLDFTECYCRFGYFDFIMKEVRQILKM